MSAEGKKKRGEAGQSNAKNIAFRNGGSKCNLSTHHGATTHPRLGGAKFLTAMVMGVVLQKQGFAGHFSDRAVRAADACLDHCSNERVYS